MFEPRLMATCALLGAVVVSIFVGRRLLGRLDLTPEQRQRTRNVMRYGVLLILGASLITVWADVVSEAALVASGFAVALVLFHKDLILNVLGWWQKTMSGAYKIGDRIRIGALRGDVLDYGVLSTTLMAVDPDATHGMRTGNVLIVPNMKLLTEPVLNETLVLGFEWKEYRFTVPVGQRAEAESALLEAAQEVLAPHQAEVVSALEKMSVQFAFHPIDVAPRVFLELADDAHVTLTLRLATPARALRVTQDALNRRFLQWQQASTNP